VFFHSKLIRVEFTVIPLCFSISKESVWVLPLSTLPNFLILPEWNKNCSLTLVFPASTWANRAIFRMFFLIVDFADFYYMVDLLFCFSFADFTDADLF